MTSLTIADVPEDRAEEGAKLREGFVRLAESLLEAVQQVFPECDEVDMALNLFRNVVKKDPLKEDALIRTWHKAVKPYKTELEAKDAEKLFLVIESIDAIKAIDLRTKWKDDDFNEQSRENFWQYLYSLNTYANLYCCVPSRMIGKIEALAGKLCSELQSGTFDISSLDLNALGAGVTADLTEDEMNAFGDNVGEIYASLQTVLGQAGKGGACDGIDISAAIGAVTQMLPTGSLEGATPEMANMMAALKGGALPDMDALGAMIAQMKGKGKGKGEKQKTKRAKKRITDG